jgi:hypothetical protein
LTTCPAIFDCHVATFVKARLIQSLGVRAHTIRKSIRRRVVEKPDRRHRRLLRARRKRPRRSAAEQGDEFASLHVAFPQPEGHSLTHRNAALCSTEKLATNMSYSMTSSASESRLPDILIPSALAVFMLITIRNFVACIIGKSAGLAPLRISPAYIPVCRYASEKSVP